MSGVCPCAIEPRARPLRKGSQIYAIDSPRFRGEIDSKSKPINADTDREGKDTEHVEQLWNRARELFAGWHLNGSAETRWHGNLNIRRDRLDVARLMSDCRDVMFSAGSACASGSGRPSHVLKALGLTDAQAKSSIRLGFGRYTTLAEIEQAAALLNAAAEAQ